MTNALFDEYGHPVKVIVDPANPAQLFDDFGRPYIDAFGPDGISLVNNRLESYPLGSFHQHSQTGSAFGWGSFLTMGMQTGTTSNSTVVMMAPLNVVPRPGKFIYSFDWNRPLLIRGRFYVNNPLTNTIGRIQFKQGTDATDLTAKGIGLKISAGVIHAESFGASRKETSLGVTLSDYSIRGFLIVHTPGVSIKFYIDAGNGWVLRYTETDTSKIPSGDANAQVFFLLSATNGAGTDDFEFCCGHFGLLLAVPRA